VHLAESCGGVDVGWILAAAFEPGDLVYEQGNQPTLKLDSRAKVGLALKGSFPGSVGAGEQVRAARQKS
jgi:hypothetical protein